MMYKQSNKANKQTLRKIKTYAKQSHLPTDKIFMGASGGKAAKEKEKNNIMNAPPLRKISAPFSLLELGDVARPNHVFYISTLVHLG